MNKMTPTFVTGLISIVLVSFLVNFQQIEGAVNSEYTNIEKAALINIRNLVNDVLYKDYMKSDAYLIRFLRAKKLDLTHTDLMIRNVMKWRKENKIDGIINETIYEWQSPPYYTDGFDREGSPVVTMLPVRVDMRQVILLGLRPQAIRFFWQLLETAEVEIFNWNFEGITVLMDLYGYSLRQHACLACFGVYLKWMTDMENYYPGYSKHFIVINAPRIAIPLIDILKTVMSPHTRKTLQVYGSNKKEWMSIIHKLVEPDQIRPMFGGTLNIPDK